jgi:hypothetical protein
MMSTSWRTLRLALALILALMLAGSVGINRAAARPVDENSAEVRVMIVQAPSTGEDILAYTIKTVNLGHGWAQNAKITVPFDEAVLKLLDVQFSGTPAWITKIEAGSFKIQTERLDSGGGTTTATVRFSWMPGADRSAGLTERLTYTWRDNAEGGSGRSNLPLNTITGQPYAVLTHRDTAEGHFFSSNIFLPDEPVVFWYHTPSGDVVATEVHHGVVVDAASTGEEDVGAEAASADADGMVDVEFATEDLPAGTYIMVARGDISGFTAVGDCLLP